MNTYILIIERSGFDNDDIITIHGKTLSDAIRNYINANYDKLDGSIDHIGGFQDHSKEQNFEIIKLYLEGKEPDWTYYDEDDSTQYNHVLYHEDLITIITVPGKVDLEVKVINNQ